MRNSCNTIYLLNAKAANGAGNIIDVSDYDYVILQYGTTSTTTATVKFQGSISDDSPAFASAQSVSNHWDYIDVIDLQSGSSIDGDTGIAVSGSSDFRNVQINVDGLKWLCAIVSGYSGTGTVTVTGRGFTNN